ARNGVLKKIIENKTTPEAIIEAIFIRVLARRPTPAELEMTLGLITDENQTSVYEDIFAALINSSEFLFNH
ncbi:MAG TPA: hypothetical protein DIW81_06025, partial [Planctomycetaceae bacterium]|nr:hypothetical protein [Rubinisphaera sp.]HCS51140.1 hypothetical protein [Planctomycetaceae bacterium]